MGHGFGCRLQILNSLKCSDAVYTLPGTYWGLYSPPLSFFQISFGNSYQFCRFTWPRFNPDFQGFRDPTANSWNYLLLSVTYK